MKGSDTGLAVAVGPHAGMIIEQNADLSTAVEEIAADRPVLAGEKANQAFFGLRSSHVGMGIVAECANCTFELAVVFDLGLLP